MKVYDRIKKVQLDLTNKELIDLMANHNRQVDLILNAPKTNADG